MGYYSNKEIAIVDQPREITLGGSPGFVRFTSLENEGSETPFQVKIRVENTDFADQDSSGENNVQRNTTIRIKELFNGNSYEIKGTFQKENINNKTFYVVREGDRWGDKYLSDKEAAIITTQNLRECLMNIPFLRNNFQVTISPLYVSLDEADNGNEIYIKANGVGEQYHFSIQVSDTFAYCSYNAEEASSTYRLILRKSNFPSEQIPEISSVIVEAKDLKNDTTVCALSVYGTMDTIDTNPGAYQFTLSSDTVSKEKANAANAVKIKNELQKDAFINQNFKINVTENIISLERTFSLSDYSVQIQVNSRYINLEDPTKESNNTDNQIVLDVYTETGVFYGDFDWKSPLDMSMGQYLTTLSKSFLGDSLWFELNTLLHKKTGYSSSFLSASDATDWWSDAGTVVDYRFVAKHFNGSSYETFFYSRPLYVVNGYDYTLEEVDLSHYAVDIASREEERDKIPGILPLTTSMKRTHIMGQQQYFNFVLKDILHDKILRPTPVINPPSLGLCYKMYTQSGVYIGEEVRQVQDKNDFFIINTGKLLLDEFLPVYKDKMVGRIDVYLCGQYNKRVDMISSPVSFDILPDYLHTVNDFAFLNRLGGWDSMNFGGKVSNDFKTSVATIYKTLLPGFNKQTEIESVSFRSVEEQITVQTSAIPYHTVEWLREMSASPVVYELKTKRYIIVDDMTLKYNTNEDLYQVEMKYHYSDTFNSRMK